MIVDDEIALCEILVSEFESEGFDCLTAYSGNGALEILKNENRKIDVIISDVRMPDGTGVDLITKVKNNNPAVPIMLFVSGFSELSIREALHLGAIALFPKPFDFDKLLKKVKECLIPREQFWGLEEKGSITCEVEFSKTCKTLQLAKDGHVLNIGRGGLLLSLTSGSPQVEVDKEIQFDIIFSEDKWPLIQGKGKILWAEFLPDKKIWEIGLEFFYLNGPSIKSVLMLADVLKLKPHIPGDFS
ncbi:MAG: response regulator [Deltaproteobacteria bacterium]|nr:response regulator [Deltaproteobacteria bacterium]